MSPEEVLAYYGSTYRFNKHTGMSKSTLSNWLNHGVVPDDVQYKLEGITHGELKRSEYKRPKDQEAIVAAKKSLKSHLKFLDSLLLHIVSNNETNKNRAMFTAWCLDKYINNNLMDDVVLAMKEQNKPDTIS